MGSLPYPNPQVIFQQRFESVRRDEVIGVLLALFLGCLGVHHFYLGRVGLGILYCCFSWTGIPAFLGLIECFFMPSRVRVYNAMQAAGLAAAMGIGIPGWIGYPGWVAPGYAASGYAASSYGYGNVYPDWHGYVPAGALTITDTSGVALSPSAIERCRGCGRTNPIGARFCSNCGVPLA